MPKSYLLLVLVCLLSQNSYAFDWSRYFCLFKQGSHSNHSNYSNYSGSRQLQAHSSDEYPSLVLPVSLGGRSEASLPSQNLSRESISTPVSGSSRTGFMALPGAGSFSGRTNTSLASREIIENPKSIMQTSDFKISCDRTLADVYFNDRFIDYLIAQVSDQDAKIRLELYLFFQKQFLLSVLNRIVYPCDYDSRAVYGKIKSTLSELFVDLIATRQGRDESQLSQKPRRLGLARKKGLVYEHLLDWMFVDHRHQEAMKLIFADDRGRAFAFRKRVEIDLSQLFTDASSPQKTSLLKLQSTKLICDEIMKNAPTFNMGDINDFFDEIQSDSARGTILNRREVEAILVGLVAYNQRNWEQSGYAKNFVYPVERTFVDYIQFSSSPASFD